MLTDKIMFHVRAFKADIITEQDLEQAINEELYGPVTPPAIDRDWYTIKEDGTPDFYNRYKQ